MISPRIAVNSRWMHQPPGGVRRFAAEISQRLAPEVRHIAPSRPLHGLAGHLWEQLVLPRRAGARVLWSPANTGPLMVREQVLTIHDLGPIDHPEWYRPLFAAWYRWLWSRLAARVRLILAPSKFSQKRITAGLGVDSEKVRVVYGGVDRTHFYPRPAAEIERVLAEYGLSGDYLLFVGDLQPRKNLAGLLAAWRSIHPEHPGIDLVIAGGAGRPFRPLVLDASHGGKVNGRVPEVEPGLRFLGRVQDTDLPALYSGARLFVAPSLYEGGGLTVLEALSCGCPVLAAGNTGMAEYLGDAGWTFDPDVPGALENALGEALTSDPIQGGIDWADRFTWEMAAGAIKSIFREIR